MSGKTIEVRREQWRKWLTVHPERAVEIRRRNRPPALNKEPKTPYYLAHREEIMLLERLRHYDLTVEEFDAMVKRAGGRCECCDRENDRLQIDHHHGSGAVRGLICQSCNIRVDLVEHDRWINPNYRDAVERYIERHLLKTRPPIST